MTAPNITAPSVPTATTIAAPASVQLNLNQAINKVSSQTGIAPDVKVEVPQVKFVKDAPVSAAPAAESVVSATAAAPLGGGALALLAVLASVPDGGLLLVFGALGPPDLAAQLATQLGGQVAFTVSFVAGDGDIAGSGPLRQVDDRLGQLAGPLLDVAAQVDGDLLQLADELFGAGQRPGGVAEEVIESLVVQRRQGLEFEAVDSAEAAFDVGHSGSG